MSTQSSGVCDICSAEISSPSGYLLVTRQVVGRPQYWQRYYRQHEGEFALMGVPSYEAFKRHPTLRALSAKTLAGQSTPWMVCEGCIGLFDVDRRATRRYAEQWWQTGGTFAPPGVGPAPLSAVNMDEAPAADPRAPARHEGFIDRLTRPWRVKHTLDQARRETAAVPRATMPQAQLAFDWVRIPAGEFLMGSDPARDKECTDDEKPQQKVYLREYAIARVPVTVAQFEAFVNATGYQTTAEREDSKWTWRQPHGPGSDVSAKANHPVTCVSWHDAQAFCARAGVRLPSEAEWEKAARGQDGRIWPWGSDEAPDGTRCNFGGQVGDTTPVGTYSPRGDSPYGCADMASNVWEWCSSLFAPYPYAVDHSLQTGAGGREDPQAGGARVLRGGAFDIDVGFLRCAARIHGVAGLRVPNGGFRVAVFLPAPGS